MTELNPPTRWCPAKMCRCSARIPEIGDLDAAKTTSDSSLKWISISNAEDITLIVGTAPIYREKARYYWGGGQISTGWSQNRNIKIDHMLYQTLQIFWHCSQNIFFLNPQWFQSYYRHTKIWNLKWRGARARMRWMKMLAKHEREGCSKSGNGREWGSRAKDRPDFHFRRGGGGVVASAQGPRTPQCLHHALAGHGRTSGGQNATFSHCHIWLGLVLLLLWSVPSRTNF